MDNINNLIDELCKYNVNGCSCPTRSKLCQEEADVIKSLHKPPFVPFRIELSSPLGALIRGLSPLAILRVENGRRGTVIDMWDGSYRVRFDAIPEMEVKVPIHWVKKIENDK